MDPVIVVGGARVFAGDCREALKHLPDSSVDSVVTDPPYELGFMGKSWDSSGIAYDPAVWAECLRVLKPGGHILAFGGSRTWHRLAVAVEDAGFELRDSIAWIYGSGFPKSLDVSKAIDKRSGAEREVVGTKVTGNAKQSASKSGEFADGNHGGQQIVAVTAPATSEAKAWEGWGTALKPAFEPVVVGRKPFGKGVTVAENVLAWGVGGLNIDGSRIKASPEDFAKLSAGVEAIRKRGGFMDNSWKNSSDLSGASPANEGGRWPANVIFDEVTAGLLDEQSGQLPKRFTEKPGSEGFAGGGNAFPTYADGPNMGASRFFYVAKASKRDRNEGLEELGEVEAKRTMSGGADTRGRPVPVNNNFHPTVKPTALMRYLIKLVTPPGGTVLDPFTGSGSTGKAALLDGFQFVGVELTEEYLPIIEGRLRWANEQEETDERLF
jgi:site-specific DNA-methyltransferase (adenine-specific)